MKQTSKTIFISKNRHTRRGVIVTERIYNGFASYTVRFLMISARLGGKFSQIITNGRNTLEAAITDAQEYLDNGIIRYSSSY